MMEHPVLQYESTDAGHAPRRRPAWVWIIMGVYALLLVTFLLGPMILSMMSDASDRESTMLWTGGGVGLLMLAGVSLFVVPVRVATRRPLRRSHILWPILGSGAMVGLLVLGAGLAIIEWMRLADDAYMLAIIVAASMTWLVWAAVFILLTWSTDPSSFSMKMHRKVMAGSVAELLVAVPAHVVVRQRTECCAGFYTAAGICVGVSVLLVACGPAVLLLYWRRWTRIRNDRPPLKGV